MMTVTKHGLETFTREEFATERFDYRAGEHVVFGGPTQRGKTTLAFCLLEHCATPSLPAYVAVSKPRDPTTESWGKKLNYVRVAEWPAPRKLTNWNPSGYLIWPKFGSLTQDVAKCARITSALLNERYAAGIRNKKAILVMDDTMVKGQILGLDKEMKTILAMSGAMGIGQWTFVQKPTDSGSTPIWAFGASEHVFLARDPDARNRKRYDEIGGVDSSYVSTVTNHLAPYEFLYIKRTGGFMAIVGSE